MVRIKILKKQSLSTSKLQNLEPSKRKKMKNDKTQNTVQLIEYDPLPNLLDVDKMGAAIMQCLLENNTEGVLEIIEEYLYAKNKSQFLQKANVPRSTAYNFIKRRNPTIKTLAKIIHASSKSK